MVSNASLAQIFSGSVSLWSYLQRAKWKKSTLRAQRSEWLLLAGGKKKDNGGFGAQTSFKLNIKEKRMSRILSGGNGI